ncbi:MAG: ChrB protein [Chloroflexi bacterium]|nr:ChrB protein [Chloroflexota bacterium]
MVTNSPCRWVLLIYRVPPEPTAGRVSVWRKLKRIGAILLHDSVWVLPASPRTMEQFQWLATEISELGGEAMLWQGALCLAGQAEALVHEFLTQVDVAYAAILTCLQRGDADLVALSRRYQQIKLQDHLNSALGQRAREALIAAGGGTDS